MAGTGGMKEAIDEGHPHQAPKREAISFGRADHAGERTVKECLLRHHPANYTADHRGLRAAPWSNLGPSGMDADSERASDEQRREHCRMNGS